MFNLPVFLNRVVCAHCMIIDFKKHTLISPGEFTELKQHENNNNSHQELISNAVWSSIYSQ